MNFDILKSHKSFGGATIFAEHSSVVTNTKMKFSYYQPEKSVDKAIIWLSGLTCTEENFITKAGAQEILAEYGVMVICPDTSPRGLNLPEEHESYDFGSGAGFYLSATSEHYKDHYKMDAYILDELVPIIRESFSIKSFSISGHSMGGHGALTLGLKNPKIFDKISAFSPIVNPMNAPWGVKAFSKYLGENKGEWAQYDTCELLKSGKVHPSEILIDQGTADEFFENQLMTKNFEEVAESVGQKNCVRYQDGYDHSYYFIATFLRDHIKHLVS